MDPTFRHYGIWTEAMDDATGPVVRGREVWDLGAGFLGHSHHLLALGARCVVAVDKDAQHYPSAYEDRPITFLHGYFSELQVPDAIEVAFLAWPDNHHLPGLIEILRAAERVVYVGTNTEGSACGWPGLWDYLHFREPLAYVPHRRNSLIVYGRHLEECERRPQLGEEAAASNGIMMTFDDSERIAREVATVTFEMRGVPVPPWARRAKNKEVTSG